MSRMPLLPGGQTSKDGLFQLNPLWDSRARYFPLDLFLFRLDEILELMTNLSTCFMPLPR